MPPISATQDQLHHLMERGVRLPPLPAHGAELLAMLRQPSDRLRIGRLAELVEEDAPLAARLLRVANSPLYSVRRGVTRVSQAMVVLGLDETLAMLNYYLVRQIFAKLPDLPGFTLDGFWRHSLSVATVARMLGQPRFLVSSMPGELYTSGLLHDLGKLVLAVHMSDRYRRALELACQTGLPLHEAERQTIGIDHAILGGQLLDNWNLPSMILDAVACHHDPESADPENRECAALVQYAHALLAAAGDPPAGDPVALSFSQTWLCRNRPDSPLASDELQQRLVMEVCAELDRRARMLDHAERDAREADPDEAEDQPGPVRRASRRRTPPRPSIWQRMLNFFKA